jgi:hypothetical protein
MSVPQRSRLARAFIIKLENGKKNLYKDSVKCEQHTCPEDVIFAIGQARGGFTTTRIGETISENYGLHMSPDKSFQFYIRVFHESGSEENV